MELGIGVRVRVGWTPDDHCDGGSDHARLREGVIEDGPFAPGEILPEVWKCPESEKRVRNGNTEPLWVVRVNDKPVGAVESLIFPIDGDPARKRSLEDVV